MNQDIQVFALKSPDASVPKPKRRHRLKWRVNGREKSKTFRSKAEGERLRSQLLVAVSDGLPFDVATLMPIQWNRSTQTWWSWSTEWLALKWPRWAGKSRKSGVESLIAFTPHLVRPGAPNPPDTLGPWLWSTGYRPDLDAAPEGSPELAWLERWSVPLDEIGPALLEIALTLATTKRDGKVMAASVVRRRRNSLKTVLTLAVRRGLIPSNPADRMEWTLPTQSLEVDVSTVASIADVDAVVAEVASLKTGGARFPAFYAIVAFAGMRPSEAADLVSSDLELPRTCWGSKRRWCRH